MFRGYKARPLNETFILKIGIKIYTQSKTVVLFSQPCENKCIFTRKLLTCLCYTETTHCIFAVGSLAV